MEKETAGTSKYRRSSGMRMISFFGRSAFRPPTTIWRGVWNLVKIQDEKVGVRLDLFDLCALKPPGTYSI
jgi:hypothetical protein